MKTRRKGFTLIELLVVIAIIALLMAVLIPSLQRAKKLAKRIVCGNHLHQCSVAMMTYAAANDGKLPEARGYTLRHITLEPYRVLESVIDTPKIFVCPFYTYFKHIEVSGLNAEFDGIYEWEPFPSSYNFGQPDHGYYIGYFYLGGRNLNQWSWQFMLDDAERWRSPRRMSDRGDWELMVDVIETARGGDGTGADSWTEAVHRDGGWKREYWGGRSDVLPEEIDAEGINAMCLDGSVTWRKMEKLEKHPRSDPGKYQSYGFW